MSPLFSPVSLGGIGKATVTGTTGSPTVDSSSRSGKTIYTFTGSGSITFGVTGTIEALLIGGGGAGGTIGTSNYFSCMGFFQSIAGQTGGTNGTTASTTTFLNGGAGGSFNAVTNYGYQNGIFQIQPIIVGAGGSGTTLATNKNNAGIGCGGGGTNAGGSGASGGVGGNGLVVIITW